jgi:hypothetical protein
MATYNGHKNWNHWNVSLWINNDEPLYRMAKSFAEQFTRDHAAKVMLRHLPAKTPDGAPYSLSSVRAAMTGLTDK